MVPRWLSLAIWAAVAAGVAALALHLLVPVSSTPSQTRAADPSMPTGGDVTSPRNEVPPPAPALAPGVAPASAGDRFRLAGVVAASRTEGVALIAVDGQPARALRVGATVEGDIVVREVSARGVTLGPRGGGSAIALELSLAAAPAQTTAPVPTAESGLASQGPLYDGSAQSQEVLRKLGSKFPPLPPQAPSAPKKPVDGTAQRGDDGSWRP